MSLNVSLPGALLDSDHVCQRPCLRVQGKTEMPSIESYVGRCQVGPKSGPNNEKTALWVLNNEKVNLRVLRTQIGEKTVAAFNTKP